MPAYYGVAKGRMVGVFRKKSFLCTSSLTIRGFDKAVKDYPDALWQKFQKREEAEAYVEKHKKDKPTAKALPKAASSNLKATAPRPKEEIPKVKESATKEPSANIVVALVPAPSPKSVTSQAKKQSPVKPPLVYSPAKAKPTSLPEPSFGNFLDRTFPGR
jgi:hypothetical protein